MSYGKSLSHPSAEQCDRLEDPRHMARNEAQIHPIRFTIKKNQLILGHMKRMASKGFIQRNFNDADVDVNLQRLKQPATMFGASWFPQLHRRPAQTVITMGGTWDHVTIERSHVKSM